MRDFFSDSSGTTDKESHLWAKPSSLGKTFLGILDPKIPRFVDSARNLKLEREFKCLSMKHETVAKEINEKKMEFKVEEASNFLIEELEQQTRK